MVKVLLFGSVPLKTYLPDGDIDLTTVSQQRVEDELATDICNILRGEEHNTVFPVKDVQYIQAQVKLIKFTVKNIPVDISFNQMAGLGALCFLEQVDQLLGKDHLFKRSIILIKAWCYYESRILGAHHGLISTYALEILVLYIINIFHSSLCGPLAVLYRFLEYFSAFNWESYCVSLNGPIAISSLQNTVESSHSEGYGLLLSQEFLRKSKEIYAVPTRAADARGNGFPVKYLNIVDPLNDTNNLGRSVNKGNFHRIRCAFSYGLVKLGEVLVLQGESLGEGLERFFVNTLDRNGKGQRQDIQVPVPAYGTGRSEMSELGGNYTNYWSGFPYQRHRNYTIPVNPQPSPPPLRSQLSNWNAWSSLGWLVQCRGNIYSLRDIPRQINFHPNVHRLSPATSFFEPRGVSRGTGTYIPHSYYRTYDNMHVWVEGGHQASTSRAILPTPHQSNYQIDELPELARVRNGRHFDLSPDDFPLLPVSPKPPQSHDRNFDLPESASFGNGEHLDTSPENFPLVPVSPKPPQRNGHIDNLPESSGVGNVSQFNLQTEDFPLLPVGYKPPEEVLIQQSSQPTFESPQTMDPSTSSGDIELATSAGSSLQLAVSNLSISDAPTSNMSEPGDSTMKMQPQVEETSSPNL